MTRKIVEIFYLMFLGIYLLYGMSTTSTFFFPFPGGFIKCLIGALSCSAGLHFLFVFPEFWKKPHDKKWLLQSISLIWIIGVYLLVYKSDRFPFLLFLAVVTIGSIGIDYKKLSKIHFVLFAGFLLVTFFSSLSGAIDNYIYMKDGFIRSSWGLCYPTDFASSLFFAILFFWIGWREVPEELIFLCAVLCACVSRVIAMSFTSTFCCSLFALILAVRILYRYVPKKRICKNELKIVSGWFLILSFPILAGTMLFLIEAYGHGNSFALIANNLLSGRLRYAWDIFQEYGLTLFGTPFEQMGNGFSQFSSKDYHFVDSSYPLILLRYGVVLFSTYCITWPYTVKRAIKADDWRLALAMALIAIHSFSEHHFIEVNYNLLVAIPFASIKNFTEGSIEEKGLEKSSNKEKAKSQKRLSTVLVCFSIAVCIFVMPVILSWTRTIVEILGWSSGGWNGIRVAFFSTALLFIIGIFLYSVYWLGVSFGKKRFQFRKYLLIEVICIITIAVGARKANQLMADASDIYEPVIQEDKEMLQQVLELAEGSVYVNEVPVLYRRHFPKLKNSIFYKDELARCYGITAVMNRDYDSSCFINSGFLFVPISKRHAIYTNDISVIRGLEKKGIHLTGYYNVEKKVDLQQMAWINGLSYGAKTGIALSGKESSMKYGPYLALYEGIYSVWYDLSLEDGNIITDMKDDELLGTLCVKAHYGEENLKEQKVFRSQFDENGHCSVEVQFLTGNYAGIEFQAIMEEGKSLKVEGLRYARTPDYDVHSFYNKNRKKYRDEYYSLEGQRITTSDGYAAAEYEYNYDWVVDEIRYYDVDNNPVLIKDGYAKVKRKLDEKNRIIREEYYDTEGKPILLEQGYAVNEREYDEENNAIVQRYYNTSGELVITNWKYAEVHRVFDEKRRVIQESYYGTDGKPLNMQQGYSMIQRLFDVSGNILVQKYCDSLGNPVMTIWNYAEVRRVFNEKNQVVEESYYDKNGQPITTSQGYAINKREYDADGNAVIQRYCDASGKSVITTGNYSEIHRLFDENHRIIQETYYDVEGKPLALPSGQAGEVRSYDADGHIIVVKYVGINEQPVKIADGYAEIHREYNENNQISKESYYDEHGIILTVPQGYAVNEREYDNKGNTTLQRFLDTSGNPVMTTWNYAEVRRVFNENRQVIRESYFGVDGQPINMPQGYAVNEREYDNEGNTTVQRFLDASGNPVMTTWNYAEVRRVFNEKRQVIRESYFGVDGQPINMPQGYAVNEREYDNEGNTTVQRFLDASGNPVMTTWNYAEVHRVFNEKKQVIRESYFGLDGQPINMPQGYAINEREYDDKGNTIVQRFLDESGNPVMTTWNYAEVHRVFNAKKQVIRESYFDVDGQPINMPQGYVVNEREYDDAGNACIQRYLNGKGQLVMTTWGYAEVHRKFDKNRQVVEEIYYDTEGKEITK